MEIKKKGKKWVAVDTYGVEYTHHSSDLGSYAAVIASKMSLITYLTPSGMLFRLGAEEFNSRYKPIEPPAPFWHKYKVDTPVLVRNSNDSGWNKRYFCGVRDGRPSIFINGTTSWSSIGTSCWNQITDVKTGEVWKVN